jgi:signal transduction histidine kinase
MLGSMVRSGEYGRPSRLIAFRAYLIVILACTLLLFSLSLISLVRQQNTVKQLSRSNLKFAGERIAFELESSLPVAAATALKSSGARELWNALKENPTIQDARTFRVRCGELEASQPLSRYFVVAEGRHLVFPVVASPPAKPPEDRSPAGRQFAALLSTARPDRHLEAIEVYRQAEALEVPSRLKAYACSLAAAAQSNASGAPSAVPHYRKLLTTYGDQYDAAQVPYAVALSTLPDRILESVYREYTLESLYRDIVVGRWEMSAEQTESYLQGLEHRLGLQTSARPATGFLESLEIARATGKELHANPSILAGSNGWVMNDSGRSYIGYFSKPDRTGAPAVLGVVIPLPWIQENILPQVIARVLGTADPIPAMLERDEGTDSSRSEDIVLGFVSDLSPWKLRIATSGLQMSAAAAHRELWFVGLASGMFLSILSLGVYLLIRVARDLQWFKLQSEFVSGVSHELKTPLSLIRLYSETLADDEQSFPPEERQSYIRIIARESERLTHLIDNVLDFSKIQQGRKKYPLEEGDLAEAVSQTVNDYSEYLSLRGFSVRTGIQPDVPAVKFNADQVSQLVINLMDNARKYSGDSRLIRVHLWHEGNDVVLEVRDYGIGIEPEYLDRIFQPFFRIQRAGEKGGCGLGLYLVKHVVDGHGGRIEVDSTPGQGSQFRVYLPQVGAAVSVSGKTHGVGKRGSVFEPS